MLILFLEAEAVQIVDGFSFISLQIIFQCIHQWSLYFFFNFHNFFYKLIYYLRKWEGNFFFDTISFDRSNLVCYKMMSRSIREIFSDRAKAEIRLFHDGPRCWRLRMRSMHALTNKQAGVDLPYFRWTSMPTMSWMATGSSGTKSCLDPSTPSSSVTSSTTIRRSENRRSSDLHQALELLLLWRCSWRKISPWKMRCLSSWQSWKAWGSKRNL